MALMKARARHILVATEKACNDLKAEIEKGAAKFADLAKKHSSCPSGQEGGDLGEFRPGSPAPGAGCPAPGRIRSPPAE